MIWLRSAVFSVLALSWTAVLSLLYLPLLLAPRRVMQRASALWCRGLIALVGVCCGLRWRVIGRENLPEGAAVIAAKHQSAWDTLIFHVLVNDPVFVLKRELLAVPLVGWYMRKAGSIAVDRGAGFRAMKRMLPEVERALADGAQVIVFPEGTRTAPGQRRPYQPGIAAIYARVDTPIVPIALNSGMFWSRRGFLKFPGVITLRILPPMPLGMHRTAFMDELERRIEETTELLCAEVAEVPRGSSHPLAPLAPSPQGEGRGKGSSDGRATAGRRTGA
jgi:1-acyl-sn-glycerol-3-phosphate acyltransferase